MEEVVCVNQYVIVQRDKFMKFHRLTEKQTECRFGNFSIDLKPIVGQPFWSCYKIIPLKGKNLVTLQKTKTSITFSDVLLKNTNSGVDNRDIIDDGSSQKLSTAEIVNLKEKGLSAQDIVGTLIENSKTFASKTEYSQEKYLKKKERKYSEFIVIRKPTFRLVAEILLGKGISKQLGLRMDSLAQLTTIACVRPGGSYILYETGCQGLVVAALLNAIGNEGTIFHLYAGNFSDKHAVNALNLPQNHLDCLLSVNITNLLRKSLVDDVTTENNEEKCETPTIKSEDGKGNKRMAENIIEGERKKPRWIESENKAKSLLVEHSVDGLIVVGKEHPLAIIKKLLPFLKPSRPFVTFCSIREPLQESFVELKQRSDVIALRLTESWLRSYQVLPDRTHPDINMSGSSGFLLSGIKVIS